MNLTLTAIHALLGATALLIPHMSRRYLYFGVHVGEDFRASDTGRRTLRNYRFLVLACTAVSLLLQPVLWRLPELAAGVAPLLPFAGAAIGWVLGHRAVKPHSASPTVREAELVEDDRLPKWIWLAVIPYAVLTSVGLYLVMNWGTIPERYPVHFDLAGNPNGWATKTPMHVFGSLLGGAALLSMLLVLGIATFYGARRSRLRTASLGVVISSMYLTAFVLTSVGLLPLVRLRTWAVLGPVFIFVTGILIWSVHFLSQPDDEPVEATPDECWYGGFLYYNPKDPAILVEKRAGIGYTFNFANRWAWVWLGGLLLVVALVTRLLGA